MKIELFISAHNLGNCNTADDNKRYANAVKAELQSEYPEANVYVAVVRNSGSCRVSNDPTGKIEENVDRIANQVWCNAYY